MLTGNMLTLLGEKVFFALLRSWRCAALRSSEIEIKEEKSPLIHLCRIIMRLSQ